MLKLPDRGLLGGGRKQLQQLRRGDLPACHWDLLLQNVPSGLLLRSRGCLLLCLRVGSLPSSHRLDCLHPVPSEHLLHNGRRIRIFFLPQLRFWNLLVDHWRHKLLQLRRRHLLGRRLTGLHELLPRHLLGGQRELVLVMLGWKLPTRRCHLELPAVCPRHLLVLDRGLGPLHLRQLRPGQVFRRQWGDGLLELCRGILPV